MFACNGILFNHESPLRGETFVTRKITRAASRIALGLQDKMYLGNLDAKRDWGHAKDYVRMMWMILQANEPEDWVIATGVTTSIRDFIRMAFQKIGIEVSFKGEGVEEKGYITGVDSTVFNQFANAEALQKLEMRLAQSSSSHGHIIELDPRYFRPTEVDLLIGDATKAREKLGWQPEYDLADLISDMRNSDMKLMQKEDFIKKGGYEIKNYFE